MRRRWGMNFICDAPNFDYNKARVIVERLKPDWIVVINGLSFAKEIAAKYPETNAIVRWVGADNDTRKAWPEPKDFIAWANQEFGGARLWANVSNENGFSGDMLKYWIDVIDQSSDLRLSVGGLSVGTPEPKDWRWPLSVELLKRLDIHRNRVVLSLHEYYAALPTAGMGGIDHTITNIAGWPQDIRGRDCWLAGRYQFLIQACQELEIGTPEIVITEHGADRIDQFKVWLDGLIKTPPYTEIRGFNTLTNQYRAWYGKDAQPVLTDFNRYSDRVLYYHPSVVGIAPFAACSNASEWNGFNLMDKDEVLDGMAELNNQTVTAPARKYEPGEYIMEGDTAFNVRPSPSTSGIPLGKLNPGDTVRTLDVDAAQSIVDNRILIWQQVDITPKAATNLTLSGWVAVTDLELTLKVTEPPAPPPPLPPITVLTRDELLLLADTHERMAIMFRAAAGRLAA